MSRWSKLQKQIYNLIDPNIKLKIHCTVYPMHSQWGSTGLPRYWITLNDEIIFDYPKQFIVDGGNTKNYAQKARKKKYPYNTDISDISDLIKEYINTPENELLTKYFESDYWGLVNILRAADRRFGSRRLAELKKKTDNKAAQKIIFMRLSLKKPITLTIHGSAASESEINAVQVRNDI